jgi:chromosome segregation ATPase
MAGDKKFKLQFDEETTETNIKTEIEDLRLEKLSHRITLISILIPLLIVVVLAVAYIDIKRRVIKTQDRGTMGVQHLTESLESRFSSLSLKQAQLEENLAKGVAAMDQSTAAMDQSTAAVAVKLQKIEERIKKVETDKIGKNQLGKDLAKSDQAVQKNVKEIAGLAARHKAMQQEVEENLDTLQANLVETENILQEHQIALNALTAEKITKNQLDLALRLAAIRHQEEVKQAAKGIDTKMAKLQKEIETEMAKLQKEIETLSGQVKKALASKPPAQKAPQKTPPKKTAPKKPATTGPAKRGSTTPDPGDILEQNIE